MPSFKVEKKRSEVEILMISITEPLRDQKIWFEICGSYRRRKDVIGDIDLAIGCNFDVFEVVIKATDPHLMHGANRMRTYVIDGVQFNVYRTEEDERAAMILFLTGPWEFNRNMRSIAKSHGMLLNQYGLFIDDTKLETPDERSIFEWLSMEFKEPPMRE
jgi:DNA polymerase (family X)